MKTIPEKMVKTVDSFPEKLTSGEIRQRFDRLLGEFRTPSVDLNLQITDEMILPGDVVRQRVEYNVDENERIGAVLLFKMGTPDGLKGILSLHAHGGDEIFPHGKEYHCHPDPKDPDQYSYHAALAGFKVLAPDALCFGERQSAYGYSDFFHDEVNAHAELCGLGKSLAWKSVWDNSRAIEALEAMGCESIGVIGASGGSTQAYILAAANQKIRAAACILSFMTLRHQFYQFRCNHCLYHFIPGMMNAGIDWDQVVSLIAPRKIFLGWCPRDAEGSPQPMYQAFIDALQLRSIEENLEKCWSVHEDSVSGHEISRGMLDAALGFLKSQL